MKKSSFAAAFRYYIHDYRKAVIVFYGVMLAVYALVGVGATFTMEMNGKYSISGTEVATQIMFFVFGTVSLREALRFFCQLGVGRKTLCKSNVAAILCMAAVCSVLDHAYTLLLTQPLNQGNSGSPFALLYNGGQAITLGQLPLSLLWNFGLNLLTFFTGFCIAGMFYRLEKGGRIALAVGVPALLLIILPSVDHFMLGGGLTAASTGLVEFVLGLGQGGALQGVACFLVINTALGLAGYRLLRRAPIRK